MIAVPFARTKISHPNVVSFCLSVEHVGHNSLVIILINGYYMYI